MYYYAPIYRDPTTGNIQPGERDQQGDVVAPAGPYAPGTRSLRYDSDNQRVVVSSSSPLTGWLFAEAQQVNADYPGLLPGGD
jgi:hypothetical protein